MSSSYRECQFDGLVGPTHNYGGLSLGNIASTQHGGEMSSPRAAALEGLSKMRFVSDLGVAQAVLPPQERPHLKTLRDLGFLGKDEEILAKAASAEGGLFLRLVSSSSAMWTANAATIAPSIDTADKRMHLTTANLAEMFHRMIEVETTYSIFKTIFSNEKYFQIHRPLPSHGILGDEGAANHTRLETAAGALHLFAWGRSSRNDILKSKKFPARQSLEASQSIARLHSLDENKIIFTQQDPRGIDAGAFHTDVLAVGNQNFLMLHEYAFAEKASLLKELEKRLGDELFIIEASEAELPAAKAVKAYPFNSQVVSLPDGSMTIIAPDDSKKDSQAYDFLERVASAGGPVKAVHYLNVRQSMRNGGGPACLRLRIMMNDQERKAMKGRLFLDDSLHQDLMTWVNRYYRDQLYLKDLGDAKLHRESLEALDQLTQILKLGNVYDFQQ